MKQKSIGAIAFIAFLLLLPISGGAVTLSVGAASFYSWWSPSFENDLRGKSAFDRCLAKVASHFTVNPSFLVGPIASVTLPAGFSTSAAFFYGSWFKARSTLDTIDNTGLYRLPLHLDVVKWDLDVLVNYALNNYVKVFVGMRVQGYDYDVKSITYNLTNPTIADYVPYKVYQRGWGPGIGASLTLNLWGPIYLLSNASALYLSTNHRLSGYAWTGWAAVYHTVGFNGATALSFYIKQASVTISLGGRYQYLHYLLDDRRTNDWFYSLYAMYQSVMQANYNLMNDDHFYGITLAATYSLTL